MGGQLVFDWDRIESFLITRDRPVGNIVTNTTCQSWVSHVQKQCTIALVSDAQIEGNVFLTPKSWLASNNRKRSLLQYLRGIYRASLWSAITRGTKEYTWPTNWWI